MAIAKTKVDVEVKYEKSAQVALAKTAPTIAKQLQSVTIRDQVTLDRAAEFVKAADEWIAAVDAIMDPVREATHAAWKAAIKAQTDFKADVEPFRVALKQAINRFIADRNEQARQKQLQIEADQRKINEQNAQKQAKLAQKAGADATTVQEVRNQVLATPAPIVSSTVAAPKGFATPRTIYGAKIVNPRKFIEGLLKDGTMFNLMLKSDNVIDALESELRKLAGMQKEAFEFPGVELTKKAAGTGQ
jgi:hypothetical protein